MFSVRNMAIFSLAILINRKKKKKKKKTKFRNQIPNHSTV